MGLLFETIFLTKNNVKSGDKTHQRGRKAQKTVECGKRGNGKFSICSKSPQKAATNWLYTKGAVGEETKPPHKVDHSLLNRVPQNPDRPTGPNRPPAAPTSYCSPAHARQSPGGGQTTYPLHPGGVFIQDSAGSSPFSRRCLFCAPSIRTCRLDGTFFDGLFLLLLPKLPAAC